MDGVNAGLEGGGGGGSVSTLGVMPEASTELSGIMVGESEGLVELGAPAAIEAGKLSSAANGRGPSGLSVEEGPILVLLLLFDDSSGRPSADDADGSGGTGGVADLGGITLPRLTARDGGPLGGGGVLEGVGSGVPPYVIIC